MSLFVLNGRLSGPTIQSLSVVFMLAANWTPREHARQASRSIGLLTLNTWTIWNIGTPTRVSLSEAPVCATTIWSQSMTKSKLLGLAAILSAAIATPALAAGETATRPWSAPVGHRQPRAADVPTSTSASRPTLDQEDVNVDRKMSNVCRGC